MFQEARMDRDVTDEVTLTVSERDVAGMKERLAAWLGELVGEGSPPEVSELRRPEGGGLSSVSVLFDATWPDDRRPPLSLVARMPPEQTSFPVFPSYDLRLQYDVMAAVRAHSAVPVPELVGIDEAGEVAGEPMIVMRRVPGLVPTDNPPYVFGGWLYDTAPERRRELEESSIAVLAGLHGIEDAERRFPGLARAAGEDALRSHVEGQRAYYEWTWSTDGVRVPVIERAFEWLEEHWPDDPGPSVLSWGDARIGNILYDGTRPAGVLDWEMAALGPRELDLGWFLFMHRFFQDIAEVFELPGLPGFLERDAVVSTYERMTGHEVRNLDWFLVYAALRHAIVMARIKRRMIHFGEEQKPETPDDYVMHKEALMGLLDGSYEWPSIGTSS
jgi:aminoglycoside phosphotransferase (APT) family kinase protein